MKTKSLLLLALSIALIIPVSGQTRADLREMFNQGEMYILFEEYNEALPFYLDLNKLFPENSNYKYRIGQCYLNIPGEKKKSIPFLEEAVQNINLKYKEGKLREKKAPYDALYYLANAYRIDNQLDKAIETYSQFLENMDHSVYDSVIVSFQLQTCYNAKQVMSSPLYIRDKNMGDNINDRYSETNPVVTSDENLMFFTRVLPFRRALFFSQKNDGVWSGPVDIITDLNVDDKFYPTSVTSDGKSLYLYSDYDFIGNIYESKLINGQWSPVVKLNENINTKYWESHASISPDGRKLYFSSNRKGGYGGLDIYVSEIDSVGSWGPAKNLGPVINTSYHEDTPFLTEDGKTLFFSSRGHFNMGGYDIFYSSILEDEVFSVPLNAGYPLNTTDDDVFFMPVGKGYEGYIARFDEEGFGLQDIFRVEIFSDDHPRKFLIRGITRIQDLRPDVAESIKIIVNDLNDPNAVIIVYSDPETGQYEFEVKHGDYEILFDSEGTVKEIKRLTLALDHPGDTLAIALTELEKSDFEAELTVLSDSIISVVSGDSLEIRLLTEPKSILEVLVMNEGKVIATDKYSIEDSLFTYRFVPQPGKNVVDFKLTDKLSNITTARVIVERKSEEKPETVSRPEYTRVIADRQVKAFLDMLKQNADDDLKKIISSIDPAKQKFSNIDALISHLRELAIARDVDPERVDKLALKTAIVNNILTQAAVDYLAGFADGELKKILEELNIYDSKLKSWSDLKEYVEKISDGRITGADLDRLADYLLKGPDESIAIIRDKIGIYAPSSEKAAEISEALEETDKKLIIAAGEWLGTFNTIAVSRGLTNTELALLYSAITFSSETKLDEAIVELRKFAPEDLIGFLNSPEFRRIKIRSVYGLIHQLLLSAGQDFEASGLFTTLAPVIADNNLSAESVLASRPSEKGLWSGLLILAGIIILILFILLYRKRRKKEERE